MFLYLWMEREALTILPLQQHRSLAKRDYLLWIVHVNASLCKSPITRVGECQYGHWNAFIMSGAGPSQSSKVLMPRKLKLLILSHRPISLWFSQLPLSEEIQTTEETMTSKLFHDMHWRKLQMEKAMCTRQHWLGFSSCFMVASFTHQHSIKGPFLHLQYYFHHLKCYRFSFGSLASPFV